PRGRGDQCPALGGADHGRRRRRRDREGDLRGARGPAVRRPGDGVRLDRDRAPGLGDGAARVRASGRRRRRRREEDDLDVSFAGISFEADMTAEQADELAGLMEEGRATRPQGVVTALLEYVDGRGRLLAVWRDTETLDRYLAEADVPRGVELMR